MKLDGHIYRQNPRTRQDNSRQDNAKVAKTIKHLSCQNTQGKTMGRIVYSLARQSETARQFPGGGKTIFKIVLQAIRQDNLEDCLGRKRRQDNARDGKTIPWIVFPCVGRVKTR